MWESVVGFGVFMLLVLVFGTRMWSSNHGVDKSSRKPGRTTGPEGGPDGGR